MHLYWFRLRLDMGKRKHFQAQSSPDTRPFVFPRQLTIARYQTFGPITLKYQWCILTKALTDLVEMTEGQACVSRGR